MSFQVNGNLCLYSDYAVDDCIIQPEHPLHFCSFPTRAQEMLARSKLITKQRSRECKSMHSEKSLLRFFGPPLCLTKLPPGYVCSSTFFDLLIHSGAFQETNTTSITALIGSGVSSAISCSLATVECSEECAH